MKTIKLILLAVLFAACAEKGQGGSIPVSRSHDNPVKRPPIKKEKPVTIIENFRRVGIDVNCPAGDCNPFGDQLQALYNHFSDFQKRKNRIQTMTLASADMNFDAKNQFVTIPSTATDKDIDAFFSTQALIERAEGILRIHLSFPSDKFDAANFQKTFLVLKQAAPRLKSIASKIQWIDFVGGGNSCTDSTWSIDRPNFENHFDQAFTDLQKCLGLK